MDIMRTFGFFSGFFGKKDPPSKTQTPGILIRSTHTKFPKHHSPQNFSHTQEATDDD